MNMNQKDFQNIFGDAPEDFRLRLRETLDGLEEKNMKKRYKVSTVLIAAVILILALAGAGIAASQLGVFRLLDTAEPIVPLEGAQELVATNLGTSENEHAIITVEQAVFDGQGVMVQCRLSPRDAQIYAMLNTFMQDTPEDTYITETIPAEVAEGSQVIGVARADKEEETDENTVDEDEERTRAMQEASGTGLDMDLGGEDAPSQEPEI